MEADYCVDTERVFSTGHSYGGIMTYTLACERADKLRGVALVAGSRWQNTTCGGAVAAWGIHGDPDPVVSYASGEQAMARILATNGCSVDMTVAVEPTDFCVEYECDAATPVTWCTHAEGHGWPSSWASQSIKDFFDRF